MSLIDDAINKRILTTHRTTRSIKCIYTGIVPQKTKLFKYVHTRAQLGMCMYWAYICYILQLACYTYGTSPGIQYYSGKNTA